MTAVHRGQLRRLQSKVDRLRQIQAGYQTADPYLDRGLAGGSYQSTGTLRPVISRRHDTPRFAIVDTQGEVRSFVSPAPGVNLQSYLGQQVGLEGTRGYMPSLRRPHITAQRVVPLDSQLR